MRRRARLIVVPVPIGRHGVGGLGGVLSPSQIYQVALDAGFPADSAVKMVAIALKESGGNSSAFNGVAPDLSYGLWQINMIDKPGYLLGAERRAQLGISSNEALFDPLTNARAAYMIWGGNDASLARNWYINDGGVNQSRYLANLPKAQAAAAAVDAGSGASVVAFSPDLGSQEKSRDHSGRNGWIGLKVCAEVGKHLRDIGGRGSPRRTVDKRRDFGLLVHDRIYPFFTAPKPRKAESWKPAAQHSKN